MPNQTLRSAVRRSSLLLAGAAVVTGISLAPQSDVARAHDVFHAAPKARFVVKPAHAVTIPVVVKPAAGASTLLPVVDQSDIKPQHRMLADQVLKALPRFCRDHLENFYVNYDPKAANRGLGGADTIIVIGTVPDNEFRALVTHECGHVTDIGGIRGSSASGVSGFLDGNTPVFNDDPSVAFYRISWVNSFVNHPGSKDSDFVSGYAETDPFEDFAESFAFYALQKKEFQRLAKTNPVLKAKYDFMDRVVFNGNPEFASSSYKRGGRVPWDVTKLPYVWHAKK